MDTSFYSNLDFNECKRRVIEKSTNKYNGSLIHKCSDDFFSIRKVECDYGNAFARNYYGQILKTDKGTLIKGQFRLPKIVRAFISINYILIFSIDIFLIYKIMSPSNSSISLTSDDLFAALAMLFCGKLIILAVIKKGLNRGFENEYYIMNYLKALLNNENENSK